MKRVSPDVWGLWVSAYGEAGARRLCQSAGLLPHERSIPVELTQHELALLALSLARLAFEQLRSIDAPPNIQAAAQSIVADATARLPNLSAHNAHVLRALVVRLEAAAKELGE